MALTHLRSPPPALPLPPLGPSLRSVTAVAETFASPAHPLGTAGPDPGRRSRLRPDLALLALGTAILRIPALLASAHLTVDDGVFGASAVVMRAGALPFRDVFSSQGPLFLPLVWSSDLVGLRTLNSPRVLALVSGIALVLAVYAGGRIVADR
ncbi:MAG: hypothetical protein H0U26_07835, partial [Acidimicrobiia bacterium]|nr:hypothetical protein [Acidimicrobiia bacterium]